LVGLPEHFVNDLPVGRRRSVLLGKRPRCFPAFDQPVNGGVHWRGHTNAPGFTRDRATEKTHLCRQLVPDVVEHRWWVIGHGANLVHFPWIFVQLHSHRRCHPLSFVNQFVQQVAQIKKSRFVGEAWGVKTIFWLNGSLEFYDDKNNLLETLDVFWFMDHYLNYCREHGVAINKKLFV